MSIILPHRMRRVVAGRGGGGSPLADVKSVIFDFATSHNAANQYGIRQLTFGVGGSPITMNDTLSTTYNGSTTGPTYLAKFAFDTSLLLTGNHSTRGFLTSPGFGCPDRLNIVFNDPVTFDSLTAYNLHFSGTTYAYGVKDTKIYTSPSAITDVNYGAAIADGTLIFDGTIAAHTAVDEADPQILSLLY